MELYKYISFISSYNYTNGMLAQRRNNQLDQFISQFTQPNPTAPTPPTARLLSPRAQHSSNFHSQQQQDRQERTVSPNRITNTRKPMISPVRSNTPLLTQPRPNPTIREQCCANENHRSKRAQYIICIEDEEMYYCGICATQAASQGFTVNRITAPKKQKTVPHYPNYANNPRYQQLTTLMREIVKLEGEYKRKSPRAVEEHYHRQEDLLLDFYDTLINKVTSMRDQHLKEFRQEQALKIAAGQMHFSNLEMHMEDLNEAWDDIEETFQDVLEKIDNESFEDGMKTYSNTLNVFKHKLEEFEEAFRPITNLDQSVLASKLKSAEECLLTLWEEQKPTQRKTEKYARAAPTAPLIGKPTQITNLKNMHQGLPKASHQTNQGQTAFRNLFPEGESEERLPEASPQFKAF